MKKIAVVNSKSFGTYFPEHLTRLESLGGVDVIDIDANLDSVAIAKELGQYECLIASVTPEFDRTFFAHSPQLKLIARHGLGYNSVDLEAATEYGVYVTKVAGIVEQEAVAEQTLALMLALARHIPQADQVVRSKPWSNRGQFGGIELKNSVVGVIGYGNIGSRVGEILHQGFQANVLVYDPHQTENDIVAHHGRKVSLDELLRESDVITLNASANADNRELLGADEFKKMKPNVLLINTARGVLISEDALVEALANKRIKGYAADVFSEEPLAKNSPLLTFENVIVTPHIGAYTLPSLKGMGDKCVNDVEAVLTGKLPTEIVNKGVLKQ